MGSKVKYSAAMIAALTAAVIPFLHKHEDTKLESYQDVADVWTICDGVTFIPHLGKVKPGMKMNADQCADLTKAVASGFVVGVTDKLEVLLTEQTAIAHITFAYNIGIGGYAGSKALKLTNAGQGAAGCRAMGNWYQSDCKQTPQGKVCRDCRTDKQCRGLWIRRQAEIKQCLEGL